MNTVVTLISSNTIHDSQCDAVRGRLCGESVWLAQGRAADIYCDALPEDAEREARRILGPAPVDVVAQERAGRRKSLLLADMESTVIENEMLDELAAELNLQDRVAEITARAMRGELDFEEAIQERVRMLAGLEVAALSRAEKKIRIMPGAKTLVATMRAHGAYCALVSGGFDYYTSTIRKRLGFDYDQANKLDISDQKLTGEIVSPILGSSAKREALSMLSAKFGIAMKDAITVGDGANDLEMLSAAGMGVAFRAKPLVADAARVRIDYGDLTALLFIQGYAFEEFVNNAK
ncbi:MAG: phosphoserine phosphatase SerB [Rickettsiales bacterium]|nr:phosphoserine phosphatase SerB [Rickettsiales bacterium]|tara:strand:- start:70 stop:945 length:876 start_codon:yes stop_codon:yes gene_type:complete